MDDATDVLTPPAEAGAAGAPDGDAGERPDETGAAERPDEPGSGERPDEPGGAAEHPDEAGADAAEERRHEAGAGGATPSLTVLAAGLGERARQRLVELGGFELVEDVERASDADLVVVSTRLPRGEVTTFLDAVRGHSGGPVVALVHTGGEGLAVEIVRAGGVGVVAEGNEEALRAHAAGTGHDTALVDIFERQLAQTGAAGDPTRDRDPATGLPGARAFERRIAELAQSGEVPRVAFLRLLHLGRSQQRGERAANTLVRRRLTVQLTPLVRAGGAELFALDELEFALIGPGLAPGAAEQLGRRLAAVAATFAPSGHTPLALAIGHAGSEVSVELPMLCELAQRALEVAAVEKGGAVVSAETLSLGVSSTTELEAATRMVAFVEQHDAYPEGHGARVAEIAAALAEQLGYEGASRTRIQLAGLLHDIGKVALPPAAIAGARDLDDALADAYRSHPERGADYLLVSGGREVADAVRAHHEHWDGSGFPAGLSGAGIPMAARIVAVADAYENLRHGTAGEGPLEPDAALTALRALAGTRLDPSLVETALPVIARLQGLAGDVAAAG